MSHIILVLVSLCDACVFRTVLVLIIYFFFFFKQKTAYEMRISDWSSDVCSSDLHLSPERKSAARAEVRLQVALDEAVTRPRNGDIGGGNPGCARGGLDRKSVV